MTSLRTVQALLAEALRKLQHDRDKRQWIEPETGKPAWMRYELLGMWWSVNGYRTAWGRDPLPLSEVERVEQMASGHIDYTQKFAAYCADLVMKEDS